MLASARTLHAHEHVHRDGEGGRSKEEYVKRAAMVGTWKKYDGLMIPKERIASVRKLGEL